MLKYLYLGAFPSSKLIKESNGKINSLYRDDQALISGLRLSTNTPVFVVTIPDIPSFPKGTFYIKSTYDDIDDVLNVSLLNLPLLKQMWTILSLLWASSRILKNNKCDTFTVFVPYIVFHHVLVGYFLKRFFKSRIRICQIVPDIFFPSKYIKQKLNHYSEKLASKSDCFILYTEAMAGYLGVISKPFIVTEGFQAIPNIIRKTREGLFNVTYSGSLNLNYGVGRLIDAFSYIPNEDIVLDLYGDGTAVERIKDAAQKDSRIRYYGRVQKDIAVEAVYASSALINPRNSTDGNYVAYSFPSKDIEYLGSGVPTILCKIPGMPKEYYGYFIDANNGSPEDLARAILKVYEMGKEERESFGGRARSFIIDRMDVKKQADRINKMLFDVI